MTPSPQETNIPDPGSGQSSYTPIHYEQAHPPPTGDDVDTLDYQTEISERRCKRGLPIEVDGLAEVENPISKDFVGSFTELKSSSRTPSDSNRHSNCSEGIIILNDEILRGCVTLILRTLNLLNSKNGSFELR
uniref:Uncharacterized protein n=1 Tax=Glossina austeni TaxID=7395 RepID=A0A1A9VB63_GLOAU